MKNILLTFFCLMAFGQLTLAQYQSVDFEAAGQGAGWTWIMDSNGSNPPLEFIANPVSGGANTTATVAKFTAEIAGQPWALTFTDDIDLFEFDATNSTVTIQMYKTTLSNVAIKFEGASPAIEVSATPTVMNGWETLTYDFSAAIGNNYNRMVIIPDFTFDPRPQDNIVYFDNIQIPVGNVTPPAVPMVAAPVPTHDPVADNVISVFSDTYTDIPNVDLNPNWGQLTVQSTISIAGNATNEYLNLNYQGTDFAANPQDVSANGYIHMDYWTPNSTSLQFFLISQTTGERSFTLPIPAVEQWHSIDIPMHYFTDLGLGITDIHQFKVVGDGHVYFDNWYFHSDFFSPPSPMPMAPPPVPTHDVTANGVISVFTDEYTNIAGINYNPNWGQQTAVTFEDFSGNFIMKYAGLNYQGTDFAANPQDVSDLEFLHVDYWTNNSTDLGIFLIHIAPDGGIFEHEYVFTVVADQWNSIDIPLTHFSTGATNAQVPVDLSSIAQIKVDGDGTIWWDNIYFWKNLALPLELTRFDATPNGQKIELNWETSSEIDTDRFVVERSADGQTFEAISEMAAKGFSQSKQSYQLFDEDPMIGENYYRLTQYDLDGKNEKSIVVSANYRGGGIVLTKKSVDGDEMFLSYNVAKNGSYTLSALDITGKVIAQQEVNLNEGINELSMNIPNNGVIIVVLGNGLDQNIEKVFK